MTLAIRPAQVRQNFKRAASTYHEEAFLSHEINARMLSRLDCINIDPKRILDLGCGTGKSFTALSERYTKAQMIGADFSEPMLNRGMRAKQTLFWQLPFLKQKKAFLCAAEALALPFASESFSAVWSNLVLHWVQDPRQALAEIYRTLEPEGLIMFSTLGPDTLKELRRSLPHTKSPLHPFIDMHDWGDMLLECGFSDPVMDMEMLTLTYPSVRDLCADLRREGAGRVIDPIVRTLTGRAHFTALCAAYERYRTENRLPASIEVVYGHAWKPKTPKRSPEDPTVIQFYPKTQKP